MREATITTMLQASGLAPESCEAVRGAINPTTNRPASAP